MKASYAEQAAVVEHGAGKAAHLGGDDVRLPHPAALGAVQLRAAGLLVLPGGVERRQVGLVCRPVQRPLGLAVRAVAVCLPAARAAGVAVEPGDPAGIRAGAAELYRVPAEDRVRA